MISTGDIFIFITEAKKQAGNNIMASIDRHTGDRGDLTFGNVRLSQTGQEPATHYGASTGADEDYKNALYGTSHSPWMETFAEVDGWTWVTACAQMNLITVRVTE